MWLLDKLLRRVIRHGRLRVIEADGAVRSYGTPAPGFAEVTVRFADAATPDRIARSPRLGVGEAYMDGALTVEEGDIHALVDLFRANAPWGGGVDGGLGKGVAKRLLRRVGQINRERRSKRNVAHHYDLSDRLYDLFLDADRQYSCAYWTDPGAETLDQAQLDKKAHIAAKLALRPGLRILDIGCGWGGTALYLNRVSGADVLGVTLSEEQLKVARQRADAAGVADRVRFELIDYRQVEGRFDRIVSIGMFEHVGPPHYRAFFARARALLADDGVMLLHTIGRFGGPGVTDPFTARYIFPGGYNPALSEIVAASESAKLIASDVETLRLHYAYTLDEWYRRTVAAKDAVVALYDERFYRMWTFYLAGAAMAFENGGLCNFQIQFSRSRTELPITRDYMVEGERVLRSAAGRTIIPSPRA